MAGCAVGRAGRGGGAHDDGLRLGGTPERKEGRTCGPVRLSSVGCVSTGAVRRPWDFPLKTPAALMNQASDLGVGEGRGGGGGQTATLCYRGLGKKKRPKSPETIPPPPCDVTRLIKTTGLTKLREASLQLLLGAFCQCDYSAPRLAAPVRKRLID